MKKINHDIKETCIEALREHGTMQYASQVCGVSVKTLNNEMRRSEVFRRRVIEAREEGKRYIADKAIELIKSYAYGETDIICPDCEGTRVGNDNMRCMACEGRGHTTLKTDRNRLTAAIALANAYEPGFRGQTTVQGKIEHDVRVITAVPRPKYKVLDTPDKKMLKSGTVEEVIEGEVVNR